MKKSLKRTMILMAMILVMALMTVPVSATGYTDVKGVSIEQTSVSIKAGSRVGLRAGVSYVGNRPDMENIQWTSSNNSVATVSKGTVTAKKAGRVTIQATLDGETDTCTVTVNAAPEKRVNAAGCYGQLNKYRKAARANAVKRDASLERIALIRAKEMAKTGKFSHTRPNGKSGLTLIGGNKYKGENIAKGQRSCAQVTTAWFKSPGHKKNMLKKQYKKVGIAAYEYNGVIYWAQVFSS